MITDELLNMACDAYDKHVDTTHIQWSIGDAMREALEAYEEAKADQSLTTGEAVAWQYRTSTNGPWHSCEKSIFENMHKVSPDIRFEVRELFEHPAESVGDPIPMILHCPSCGLQHVDAPEDMVSVHLDGRESRWDNPPHRSHLCHDCGTVWRPADVPTTGVEKIRTVGKNDHIVDAERVSAIDAGPNADYEPDLAVKHNNVVEKLNEVEKIHRPKEISSDRMAPLYRSWQRRIDEVR